MLLDVMELPMRYLPGDNCLDTQLMHFDHPGDDNPTEIYGRKIPLGMFVDKTLWKYKTIEQWGQDVRERIFITEGRLDLESKWWESGTYAYPIQSKIFGFGDPIRGTTYRYVNGIRDLLRYMGIDYMQYPMAMRYAPEGLEKSHYNIAIPGDDYQLTFPSFIPDPNYKVDTDIWMEGSMTVENLFRVIPFSTTYWTGDACAFLYTPPFSAEGTVATDFILGDLETYRLFEHFNRLGATDIRIDVSSTDGVSVSMSGRYMGMTDYSVYPWFQEETQQLAAMAESFVNSRFHDDPWNRITIEKFWTEEVYITMEAICGDRRHPIHVPFYMDLAVFLLGTLGLD